MSYCKEFGKDRVIFVTKEDHSIPSKIELPASDPPPGLILPGGEINWNCPCLGGMATGPCGVEFRDAFSCFHFSEANPKGSDCYDAFSSMQGCFAKYPTVYNKAGDGDDDNDDDDGDDTIKSTNNKDLNIVSMLDEKSATESMKMDNDSQKIDIDKSINSIIEENTSTIKSTN